MAAFLLWIILFILCWPLALLALIAYPFVWLILLPFRIVGIAVGGVLALLSAMFFLPVRLLRGPSRGSRTLAPEHCPNGSDVKVKCEKGRFITAIEALLFQSRKPGVAFATLWKTLWKDKWLESQCGVRLTSAAFNKFLNLP